MSIFNVTTALLVVVITALLLQVGRKVVRPFFSALRVLPGPKSGFIFGNSKEIRSLKYGVWHEQMIEKYGPVMAYKGHMNVSNF